MGTTNGERVGGDPSLCLGQESTFWTYEQKYCFRDNSLEEMSNCPCTSIKCDTGILSKREEPA